MTDQQEQPVTDQPTPDAVDPDAVTTAEPTEPPPPTSSTELVPAVPARTVVQSTMPAPAEWKMIQAMADTLASSDLVPSAYRKKPANIVLAALAGRPFGWDPSMSMRSFHVIEGTPSMKPEIMLALIRRAGHSVTGEIVGDGANIVATVAGRRVDNGDSMAFSFSVTDAVNAGLCTIDSQTKRPHARSQQGKRLPWENHPKSMCWARALSQLARMLFPDVVLGAGYTPEELGAAIADDDVIDVDGLDDFDVVQAPVTVTETGVKNALVTRCHGDKVRAAAIWREHRPKSLQAGGGSVAGTSDDGKLLLLHEACEAWLDGIADLFDPARPLPEHDENDPDDDEVVDAEIVDDASSEPPQDPPSDVTPAHVSDARLPAAPGAPLTEAEAWEQLVGEVGQLTAPVIAERLRESGVKPTGLRKAKMVELLAAALWEQRLDDLAKAGL